MRQSVFPLAMPARKMPANGIVNSHAELSPIPTLVPPLLCEVASERNFFPIWRRRSDPEPLFGPVVEIVAITEVVPAPAAIEVGLKLQLVSAGRFAHAKVTAPLKVAPPAGVAEKV